MVYWLSSEDIQAKELELHLHNELHKRQAFIYLTATRGIKRMDCSEGLSDGEHKKLIRRQFKKFMDAPGWVLLMAGNLPLL